MKRGIIVGLSQQLILGTPSAIDISLPFQYDAFITSFSTNALKSCITIDNFSIGVVKVIDGPVDPNCFLRSQQRKDITSSDNHHSSIKLGYRANPGTIIKCGGMYDGYVPSHYIIGRPYMFSIVLFAKQRKA